MTYTSVDPEPKPFDQRKRLVVVRIAAVATIAMLLFTKPFLPDGSDGHELIELLGLSLVIICVGGRLWSILYVGGNKNKELISMGPFSMTQNPLYFFSTVGAVGIGLIFGSAVATLFLGLASFLVFRVTARKEADFLLTKFGADYRLYALRTPKFLPNPFLFHDRAEWQFSTHALKRTFYDGLYFLALFPAIEIIEYVKAMGILPTFFTLY
jgi:protein-S-isoprenylcysteine O-methyltransferase Ste14